MNIPEVSAASKLIKEIKFKLNELEKLIGKAAKDKYTYPVNNQSQHQHQPPRKRNTYKNTDNNQGNR